MRLTNDVGMLQDVAITAALPLLADACMLVGMLGVMFWMQPSLTALALVPLPLFLLRWGARIAEFVRSRGRSAGVRARWRRRGRVVLGDQDGAGAGAGRRLRPGIHAAERAERRPGGAAKRLAAGLERSVEC